MSITSVDLSAATTAGFIPDLWSGRAIELLRNNIVMAKLVNVDYDEGEYADVGHTLNIPYPGTFTAADKAADNLVSISAPTGGKTVTLTLSHHTYVDFLVEDIAGAQARQDLMDRYIVPAMVTMAEAVETNLLALGTNLVLPTAGSAGVDLNAAVMRRAEFGLNVGKIPRSNRYLVMSSKDETALLGDSSLDRYFANSRNGAPITEGALARIYGFDLFPSQMIEPAIGVNMVQTVTITGTPTSGNFTLSFNGATTGNIAYNATAATVQTALLALPTIGYTGTGTQFPNVVVGGGPGPGTAYTVTFQYSLGGATQPTMTTANSFGGGTSPAIAVTVTTAPKTINLAFHRDAFIMATRPFHPPPANSGVSVSTMTDPVSGLTLRVLHQYDINYRAIHVGFDMLYGMTTLRPESGLQVYS